jgi:type II secretory ATPase GspE/PulE/Tfp pilus assembly ATPase PilB-like protein
VEPFLISAALIGVMAQRLVRTICPNCREPYEPTKGVMKKWGLEGRKDVALYRGKGCDFCKGTGFRGRTGLYELMICDDEIREMILTNASQVVLRQKAREKGMKTLSDDGVVKALQGITTLEEVARVCEEHIELKAAPAAELKPVAPAAQPLPRAAAPKVQVNTAQMEEYQKRIGNWLGGKQ